MRKILVYFLVVTFFIGIMPAFAARGGRKGPDEKAYEHASDRAIFKRIGDWFSALGKSKKEEKKALKEQHKAGKAIEKVLKKAGKPAGQMKGKKKGHAK